MAKIHPLAVVSPEAELGLDVSVGPFCVIEANVRIDEGCQLASHVVIKSGTTLGKHNRVQEGAILGGIAQHVRAPEKSGALVIGQSNTIREHCTMHRALHEGQTTRVGDHNFLMCGTHVAHDCQVGSHVIFANAATLGGFVVVEDRVFMSGLVAVHQFCRIGKLAMVGGLARICRDVPPYVTIDGSSDFVVGLNVIGLKRSGITPEQISELKAAYRLIYRSGLPWNMILEKLKTEFSTGPAASYHPFLKDGKRGFVQERRDPHRATVKLPEDGTALDRPEDGEQLFRKAG